MNINQTAEALHKRFVEAGGEKLARDYAYDLHWALIRDHVCSLSHAEHVALTESVREHRVLEGRDKNVMRLCIILLFNATEGWIE